MFSVFLKSRRVSQLEEQQERLIAEILSCLNRERIYEERIKNLTDKINHLKGLVGINEKI